MVDTTESRGITQKKRDLGSATGVAFVAGSDSGLAGGSDSAAGGGVAWDMDDSLNAAQTHHANNPPQGKPRWSRATKICRCSENRTRGVTFIIKAHSRGGKAFNLKRRIRCAPTRGPTPRHRPSRVPDIKNATWKTFSQPGQTRRHESFRSPARNGPVVGTRLRRKATTASNLKRTANVNQQTKRVSARGTTSMHPQKPSPFPLTKSLRKHRLFSYSYRIASRGYPGYISGTPCYWVTVR